MNKEDKTLIIKLYNESINTYGYTSKGMQWDTSKNLYPRYSVLTLPISDLDSQKVLDVGCGFGDLYGFFLSIGKDVEYVGYDINPNMIAMAKKVYPSDKFPKAHFDVKDIEEVEVSQKFDFAFASGLFNNRISNNRSLIKNILGKMFELTRTGIAANFKSPYFRKQLKDNVHYAHPMDIMLLGLSLSSYTVLRHDVFREFCLYVYHR